MSFDTLGLLPEILRAVSEKGYTQATAVQAQAIPVILKHKDIMAGSQTGTGKTAGFVLPILQRLSTQTQDGQRRSTLRALILTPTRELADQIRVSVADYGKYLRLKSTAIFGGVKIYPQIQKLRQGIDILVATPGRLLDHTRQGTLDLSKIEVLVLDEADRMLDMGFLPDIRKILALLPKSRQNLLFSATFSSEVKQFASTLLNSPVLIEATQESKAPVLVSQIAHPVDRQRKRELLSFLIGSQRWGQALVFTRTKHSANRLTEQLEKDGIAVTAIHGNKSQSARTRALMDFKKGVVQILVATDVAARGLDIKQLPYVVNYELPNTPEDYLHRIGRTGRAGNEGKAISLVCIDEQHLLKNIERFTKHNLTRVVIPGYEPDASIRKEPIFNGRNKVRSHDGGGRPHQKRYSSGGGRTQGRARYDDDRR